MAGNVEDVREPVRLAAATDTGVSIAAQEAYPIQLAQAAPVQVKKPWRATPEVAPIFQAPPIQTLDPAAGGDPNANGTPRPGTTWNPPMLQVQQEQQRSGTYGKTYSNNPDQFWATQQATVDQVAKATGHTTYSPIMNGVMGGGFASATDLLANKVVTPRADRILADFVESKAPQPNYWQRWAGDWTRNYDPAEKANADLTITTRGAKAATLDLGTAEANLIKIKELSGQLDTYLDTAKAGGVHQASVRNAVENFAAAHGATGQASILEKEPLLLQALEDSRHATQVSVSRLSAESTAVKSGITASRINNVMPSSTRAAFLRGAGTVGIGILADHYADRFINGRDHQAGFSTMYGAASIPLAAALDVGGKLGMKEGGLRTMTNGGFIAGATIATMYIGSQLDKDGKLGGQSASYRFLPNGIDYASMGIAAGLPTTGVPQAGVLAKGLESTKTRLGMAAAGWMEGRSYNTQGIESALWGAGGIATAYLTTPKGARGFMVGLAATAFTLGVVNRTFGPGVETYKEDTEAAWKSVRADGQTRTEGSMTKAIDQFVTLSAGPDKFGPLAASYADWQGKTSYPSAIAQHRAAAILGAALGEARLKSGTGGLDAKNHVTLIPGLEGLNLDIGGEAMVQLIRAKQSIGHAKTATVAADGQTVDGKVVVKADELKELDAVNKRINGQLGLIFGAHGDSLARAVNELTRYQMSDQTGFSRLNDLNIRRATDNNNQNKREAERGDPLAMQLIGKVARDQILLTLAIANAKQETAAKEAFAHLFAENPITGQVASTKSGIDKLYEYAAAMDPNHPDLVNLRNLIGKVKGLIVVQSLKQNSGFRDMWNADTIKPILP